MSPTDDLDRASQLRRVHGVIERVVRECTVVARSDGTLHKIFPVSASAAEGEALRKWVIREEATQTIEIGLGYGISALHVCEGLLANADPTARHVVIDPYQATRFSDCGLQLLEEAGVAELVDLAFVDGNHRFDGFFVDLFYLGRLVQPGGIVFVDDYQLPAIARAASFFVTNLGWTLEEVSARDEFHEWAVLRTSVAHDTRPFDHFIEF